MNAADVLWRLAAEGLVPAGNVPRACELLGVSKLELREARARYECPVIAGGAATRKGADEETVAPDASAPRLQEATPPASSAWAPSKWRPTTAGARRAADKAFSDLREWVSLRVVKPDCSVCGEPIVTGDCCIVESARHAKCEDRTTDLQASHRTIPA